MPPSKANPEPETPETPEQPEELEGAAAFWEALDKRFDAAFDRHAAKNPPKPEPVKPVAGTSRTGAKRVTLPTIIADIVFGPKKEDE